MSSWWILKLFTNKIKQCEKKTKTYYNLSTIRSHVHPIGLHLTKLWMTKQFWLTEVVIAITLFNTIGCSLHKILEESNYKAIECWKFNIYFQNDKKIGIKKLCNQEELKEMTDNSWMDHVFAQI